MNESKKYRLFIAINENQFYKMQEEGFEMCGPVSIYKSSNGWQEVMKIPMRKLMTDKEFQEMKRIRKEYEIN